MCVHPLCRLVAVSQAWKEAVTASLCLWVALCGYIRSLPKLNYAASVAAFSASIVINSTYQAYLGSNLAVPALARIQQTIFGVAIYLVVSSVLYPQRASETVCDVCCLT